MNRRDLSAELVKQTEFEPENFEGLLRQIRFEEILSRSSESLLEKAWIAAQRVGTAEQREPRLDSAPWNAIKEITEGIPWKAGVIDVRKS